MIPILIPALYMAVDFLLDQKELVEKLRKAARERRNEDTKKELEELITYQYELGLQALKRWKSQVPDCVKLYYLGKAPKPTTEEIMDGFQELPVAKKREQEKRIEKIIKAGVYLIFLVLTLLAIFL